MAYDMILVDIRLHVRVWYFILLSRPDPHVAKSASAQNKRDDRESPRKQDDNNLNNTIANIGGGHAITMSSAGGSGQPPQLRRNHSALLTSIDVASLHCAEYA